MKCARKWKDTICSIKNCDRDVHCRGLCQTHYQYLTKGRTLSPITFQRHSYVRAERCLVPECGTAAYAKGLCHTHIKALAATRTDADRQCTVEGCAGAHLARGYCNIHYEIWRMNKIAFEARSALDEEAA